MRRFFLYIFYFFRSLYYRGLLKTLKMLKAEGHYERFFHIKTIVIKRSDDKDNYHYQGASYYILLELFKKLPKNIASRPFIDFGSGKGRALFCAEYSGFNELVGVELDEELVELAQKNAGSYSQKRKESRFTFLAQNVLNYSIPADAAVCYFFNPFSAEIMQKVAENILESYRTNKREIFIVYVNPQHRHVWDNLGLEVFYTEGNTRYTEAIVYKLS